MFNGIFETDKRIYKIHYKSFPVKQGVNISVWICDLITMPKLMLFFAST